MWNLLSALQRYLRTTCVSRDGDPNREDDPYSSSSYITLLLINFFIDFGHVLPNPNTSHYSLKFMFFLSQKQTNPQTRNKKSTKIPLSSFCVDQLLLGVELSQKCGWYIQWYWRYWRKLIFPLAVMSVAGSFLVRAVTPCLSTSPSVLVPCLAWTCAGLVCERMCAWVLLWLEGAVSSEPSFFTLTNNLPASFST